MDSDLEIINDEFWNGRSKDFRKEVHVDLKKVIEGKDALKPGWGCRGVLLVQIQIKS